MRAWEIDPATGDFIGDLPDHPDDQLGPHIVTTPCPEGFVAPRWDGAQWVEGDSVGAVTGLRARLKQQINALRAMHLYGGFTWNGHVFDTDPQSVGNVNGIVTAILAGLTLPEGFTWRTQANADIPMTAPEIVQMGLGMAAWVNALYKHSWALKAAVDAAPDPLAVDLEAGWP